jgi:type III restriction enzyme
MFPGTHERSVGQASVIEAVGKLVDDWRGFSLGAASEPYPLQMPIYEPTKDGERPVSDTTMVLLRHWFRREPHIIGHDEQSRLFKYWPHQRKLVETVVYLHEVRQIRRTEQLYRLAGIDPLLPQRDPWAKLGGQLATGSGKTKMMSLIIAWWTLNAMREADSGIGFGRHAILIAPSLFVRDRLFQDFRPDHGTSVFFGDPVVPPELEREWNLKVYSPVDCPRHLDPAEPALVVTNRHQLLRTGEDSGERSLRSPQERQLDLLFGGREPDRLEAVTTPLLERFARSRGLLVLNDEAHNVWDETGHARFEEKAKDKAKFGGEDAEAASEMAWIRSIRRLNGSDTHEGRVSLQVDLSATLFEEAGAAPKTGKGKKTKFKATDLFRHTVVQYDLAQAIADGIVKKPILERVEVRDKQTGQPEPLVRVGQPNAWEKYRNLLAAGIERWKRVKEQFVDEGDPRKPILFILCADQHEAKEIANFLIYGDPVGTIWLGDFHRLLDPRAARLYSLRVPRTEF